MKIYTAIHWTNLSLMDGAVRFAITYPLDSNLFFGQRYPLITRLDRGVWRKGGILLLKGFDL